jgi:hypothetical protein
MAKNAVIVNEADQVLNFICQTKDGKYTAEKPVLTLVTYSRVEIQESDTINTFNDYSDVILYGVSY